MDSCPIARVAQYLTHLRRCALSQCRGLAPTTGGRVLAPCIGVGSVGGRPSHHPSGGPPFCHDGTERPIPRPQDPTEQKTCYSGKKKRHMLKNLLLINAALRILFLSETQPGSVHDKRMADTTPYPLPAGSHLLQDLGFQAFTLEGVALQRHFSALPKFAHVESRVCGRNRQGKEVFYASANLCVRKACSYKCRCRVNLLLGSMSW